MNSTEDEERYNELVTFIVKKWKEEGYFSDCDDEEARSVVEAMLFLISSFNLKCLINSLFDIHDLIDEFEEANKKEDVVGYS